MNYAIFIIGLCLLCSCHKYDNSDGNKANYLTRKAEPSFTITVDHQECTGCLDASMIDGYIIAPEDLSNYFEDTLQNTYILLAGHFPFDLINVQDFFFDPDLKFRITGKLIGVDSATGVDNHYSPIFYVEKWNKLKE